MVDIGHNRPDASALVAEITTNLGQWAQSHKAADDHLYAVIEGVYRLRCYREESDGQLAEVDNALGWKTPPADQRMFSRLLGHFFKGDMREKSRLSRCAAALRLAWAQQPRVEADAVVAFIKPKGGIAACARAFADESRTEKAAPQRVPINCDVAFDVPEGTDKLRAKAEWSREKGWELELPKTLTVRNPEDAAKAKSGAEQLETAAAG